MGIQIGFGIGSARRGTGGAVVTIPEAPDLAYTINGTGAEATVFLTVPGDYTWSGAILTTRYSIDGGTPVEVSGVGPLVLTGLTGSQDVAVAWANSAGYSADVTLLVIANPPTFGPGDWSIADAATAGGDGLAVTITTPVTAPLGLNIIATEYSVNSGAWTTLPVDGEIATGVPETLASVRLRTLYDVGPSVPATAKTETPTFEPVITDFAALTHATSSTRFINETSLSVTIPAHTAGMQLFVAAVLDGTPGTVTATAGWAVTHVSTVTETTGNLYRFDKIAETSADTLIISWASAEQCCAVAYVADGARDIVVSAIDENSTSTSRSINVPGVTFSESEKAAFLLILGQRAEVAGPSAGPVGWTGFTTVLTQDSSAGVFLAFCEIEAEGASYDPAAWPGNMRNCTSFVVAFRPTAGVPPVTAVTVDVSATSIAAGETVTWTAEADGRVPVTYELTCDGVTTDNTTGIFTRTPTAGTQAWTLTATNASGDASASGSVTVEERLVFTPNAADMFEIEVDASSVVTGASYDLEWQTAAGGTATTVTQTSPTFTINFPVSDAYRFRVRADGGAWSIYGYYAVQEVGVVTYGAENVQAVQISPLSAQAPVEMVPVTGKLVKLFEVQPPVATEVWGDVTHYLNGVMVNPSAFSGRGPQGWDSRKGDGGAIGGLMAGFDAALINTTWPAALSIGDTVAKAVSRPSALIPVYNSQGTRFGVIDQHSGLVVTDALSTSSPMQAAPAIIKHDTWTPGSVSLPGYADMAAIVTSTNLSTSGMSPPSATDLGDKVLRFDPSGKVLRGGLWQYDDNEPLQPYRSAFGSTITNYYAYKADAVALAGMFSDAYSSDLKIAMLQQFILRGLQWDYPNNNARVGAGISQNYLAAGALAKIAQGDDFLEYATTQRENAPFMYGFWNATTLDYLNPHNSILLPTFALRRQIRSVTSDASGHILEVDWNNNTKTGERKQRLAGLDVVLEATNTALPHRSPDYDRPQPGDQIPSGLPNRAVFYIDGFYSPVPAVDDWVYCRIPAAAMANFVEGEPFWMYDTEGSGSDMVWDWQSFNPNGKMSYRSLQEPHGALIALHALGAYPDIPGSAWDAMKQYTVKTMLPAWPGAGDMDYAFAASGFVGDFFTAHAATLGIT